MWDFIENFAKAIYQNTIGGFVRLVNHTRQGQVDDADKRYVGRLVMYITFGFMWWFFFEFTMVLLALRIMIFGDLFGTAGAIFKDTANAYA